MADILLPMGRIVGGHPMEKRVQTDDHGNPKTNKDGTPVQQAFVAIAIPKGSETTWKETTWGRIIVAEATAGFPNGEATNRPDFHWKIDDGDSQMMNKNNKRPCDREGWPGHWVLKMATQLEIKCYANGDYHNALIDKNAIKPGDYGRVQLSCKANGSQQSPGVYLNPQLFSLDQVGEKIELSDGPDAATVFGGGAPAPAPMTPPPAPAPAPMTPPPAPAPTSVKVYNVNGANYTHDELIAFGWNEQQIASLGQ